MGKKTKTGKGRLDKYYHLAKEQGYRSRAAFKLIQLNRKYNILQNATCCIDLCAAPGGWLQVCAKTMPSNSLILGVDLAPIRAIRGVKTFIEDITTPKCRAVLKREMNGQLAQVVLHDGAPNVGGAWASEAFTQAALALEALKLATEFLAPGGTFVSKVFRSKDYNSLLFAFKKLFTKVESTKPLASRNTSAEIFVVGRGYKAPGKIDPRLLDARHLFEEVEEEIKSIDVLHDKVTRRNREGYADGVNMVYTKAPIKDFINAKAPVDMLGRFNLFTFPEGEELEGDADMQRVVAHPKTTEEIRALCADLKVLGKREFKNLLRWRLYMADMLNKASKEAAKSKEGGGKEIDKTEEEENAEEEARLLEEMGELKSILLAKKRQKKKKIAKRNRKERVRVARGGTASSADKEIYGAEADLFSLTTIKNKKQVDTVASDSDVDEDAASESGSDDSGASSSESEESDVGSDPETDVQKQKYLGKLEEYLERSYAMYTGKHSAKEKKRRAKLGENSHLWEEEDKEARARIREAERSSDEEGGAEDVDMGGSDDDDTPSGSRPKAANKAAAGVKAKVKGNPLLVDLEAPSAAEAKREKKGKEEEGFEVVPLAPDRTSDDDSSSSDEGSEGEEDPFEDYDTDDKAETVAYAQAMLRKRRRDEIIDGAYNRYTFNDDNLPRWFAEDEKKFMRPIPSITKEEMEAARAAFRQINDRPLKKVVEAKSRKRRRELKRMEAASKKAHQIADTGDISNLSKMKMIEKVFAKAQSKGNAGKKISTTRAGGKIGGGGGRSVIKLDKRSRKDSRSRGQGRHGKDKKKMAKLGLVHKGGGMGKKAQRKAKQQR
eukprot:jgi/Mesvir1/17502/Mv08767-RA.1